MVHVLFLIFLYGIILNQIFFIIIIFKYIEPSKYFYKMKI